MRARRIFARLAILSAVAGTAWVAAATLGGLHSAHVAAGNGTVASCAGADLPVTYATQGGNLTAATVSGIPDPACEGGELSVAVQDTSGARIAAGGPATIAADPDTADDQATVALSPTTHAAEEVGSVSIQIVGP